MNKQIEEIQIEEMAKTLCGEKKNTCEECNSCDMCEFWIESSVLYNAGYRKQSKGKWVCKWKSTFPKYEPSVYACSVCGYERTVLYNCCPNCGAKMKGGSDMATCKDCIHYDICIFHLKGNENKECVHFKKTQKI